MYAVKKTFCLLPKLCKKYLMQEYKYDSNTWCNSSAHTLNQGFPTFLLPRTPTAFQQVSVYPFRISNDEHVPLKFLMTKYFMIIRGCI